MRRGARDGLLDAGRETTDASLVSHLTPPRVSCLASLSTWKKAKLIELCKFQRGFDISKKEQRAGTIPVISSSGITSFHDTAKCKGPGVLVGRKGTLGTVHYCEGPYWPHSTALWVKDFKGNEPRFVYYFLKTLSFEHYDVGNANPTLNRNHVHLLDITIPPLSEQRRIVGILSAYDDLIENNRKRIALLEESARSLYKEWFVRLRFPGHERVPVEDGVPKGWKRTTLGDVCKTNRSSYRASELPPSINYIDISSVSEGRILGKTVMLAKESPGRARRKAQSGDVVWSNVRPNLKAYALVLDPEPNDVFSTGFTILTPTTIPFSFLYLFVSTDSFVSYLENMVTGATYPAVRPCDFEQATFLLPDSETLHLFHDFVSPLFLQCKNLEHQSRTLAAARDALLPRLMKNG